MVTRLCPDLNAVRTHPHFQEIIRFLGKRTADQIATLELYRRIWRSKREPDKTTLTHAQLKLTGLVKRDQQGYLVVRNPIYRRIFTVAWAKEAMPPVERRVQIAWRVAMTAALVAVLAVGADWLYAAGFRVQHIVAMALDTVGRYPVIEPKMVKMPAGEFWMGSDDKDPEADGFEKPRHKVTISKPFELGKYEVTFDEYDRFAYANGQPLQPDQGWGRGQRPVINVSWDDAVAYAQWLSARTGKNYRLPTEAEWEYAARAGNEGIWFWGNDPDQACKYANIADINMSDRTDGAIHHCDDHYRFTAEVGLFQPNGFELYDMLGNVWELLQDCWTNSNYKDAPTNGSAVEVDDCKQRVMRGGSWSNGGAKTRLAYRSKFEPQLTGEYVGFRLARTFP